MGKGIKKWGGVWIGLLLGFVVQGGNQFVEFREVSPKGGFTFGSVHQITEDSHGFIWFGSHHGLFRYNTETIEKFVHIPSDLNSISSNYITSITKDQKGTLWFATDNGICNYNERKANFERCSFFNSNKEPLSLNTSQIIAGVGDSLWILSDRKLYLAQSNTLSFDLVEVNPHDNLITFIYIDSNQRLWLRSSQGMIYFADAPYIQFKTFGTGTNQPIQTMLFTNNKLWIGYESFGAECYDIYGQLTGKYGKDRTAGFDIKSDRVRKIFEDKQGRIWFATYNGIALLDHGKISTHNDKNTRGLKHSSIYDIFTDSKGGIWVSTWSGTLSYANPYDNAFEHLRIENGLSNNVVSSIAERDGIVWIGTEGGGLDAYYPETGAIVKHNLNPQLNDEQNVKDLEVDRNNALWVGTFNDGLWLIRSFDAQGRPLSTKKILQGGFYKMINDGRYIWAASYFMGLYKIDIETLEYENFRGDENNLNTVHIDNLRTLLIDHLGGLWIGTQRGLCYRKNSTSTFDRYFSNPNDTTSISGSQIYSIFEDHNNTVWIGTSSGLSQYNPKTNSFSNFTPKEGLPGYEIYGITEDNKNHLWISTDNGITEFDPIKLKFRNFNAADGLQGNQFNPGAAYCSASGKIYFGGPNGLTIFNPNHININTIEPQPIVVDILINNQIQIPSDSTSIIKESILFLKKFKLKHDQNSITFLFVANNFLSPQKNEFTYRLLNYDEKWIQSGARKSATYTKIPPGNYIFQLKAANNDGVWNEQPLEISFRIEPPWWKRWYAYAAYLIIAFVSSFFVQREIIIRHRLRNEVLLEKIKSQSEQDLNQSKLTFFTNISHEIKTPLSLILSPLDFLIERRKSDLELVENLKTIQRNGNRLKHLLHQVIDIRRIDAGKLTFVPGVHNIITIINDMISCFSIEAREREIDFSFESEFESLMATVDSDKFDKIIFNLLTNAFKFVPDRGAVIISLNKSQSPKPHLLGSENEGEYIEIQIWNSGSFIPHEEYDTIFERFYQGKENHKRGTGIGLHMVKEYTLLHHGQIDLKSEKNEGTSFTIRIPQVITGISEVKAIKSQPNELNSRISEFPNLMEQAENDGKRKLILVVEDNAELRTFLKRSLSNFYTIITAANGKKGFEQALELNPNLIVSDVMMPVMNGFDMCRHIKNDVNTSHIPVILLTALSAEESQIEGYQTGADAYISKPFSEKLLRTQIDNLLQNRQKLKERFLDPETTLADGELGETDQKLINKAIMIVEEHLLDTNFTVEILAEKLKISRTSLHRKLKAHTDQSATEFIRFVRLKKALKMLKSGNYTIDEVSYAVGFNTPSYFSQSFKKQFGKSPKEYLAQE